MFTAINRVAVAASVSLLALSLLALSVPGAASAQTVAGTERGSEPGDAPATLPDVVVTARTDSDSGTRTRTPLTRTPQSVSVVLSAQITAQGADTVSQALSYTPGVFAEQRLDGLFDGLFIRGFGGFGGLADFNKFLDGLRLPAQYLGVPAIDPATLSRIEVLKGPASVLYGAASPGGVVNMVSKTPTGDTFGAVTVGIGNRTRIETSVDFGGVFDAAGEWSWRLSGAARSADTQVDHTRSQRHLAIAPSLRWTPDADTSLTLTANCQIDPDAYYASWLPAEGTVSPGASGRIGRAFYSGDPAFEDLDREQISVGYAFESRLSPAFTLRQNARYLHLDQSYRGLTVNYLDPIGATLSTLNRWATDTTETVEGLAIDNQIEARFSTGDIDHVLLVGLELDGSRSDWVWRLGNAWSIDASAPNYDFDIGSTPLATYSDQIARSRQAGLYLQDQITRGRWSVLVGGRQDWVSTEVDDRLRSVRSEVSDTAFSGRAGLTYSFDNGFSPYVSYATSFEPIVGADAKGDPYRPSKGEQVEVGVKYRPSGVEALITLAAFDIRQTNVRTLDSVLNGYVQTGAVRSRGVELEARAAPAPELDLTASVAWTDAEVTADETAALVGNTPASSPEWMASVWAGKRFTAGGIRGLSLGGGLRHVGDSQGDAANSFKVPEALLADARLGFDLGARNASLTGLEAALTVRNLFDKDYVSSCFSSGGCFYAQARTATASLTWRW